MWKSFGIGYFCQWILSQRENIISLHFIKNFWHFGKCILNREYFDILNSLEIIDTIGINRCINDRGLIVVLRWWKQILSPWIYICRWFNYSTCPPRHCQCAHLHLNSGAFTSFQQFGMDTQHSELSKNFLTFTEF